MFEDKNLKALYNEVRCLTVEALEWAIREDEYAAGIEKLTNEIAQYIGTDAARDFVIDAQVSAENVWAASF